MWQGRLGLAARARAPLPHRVLQLALLFQFGDYYIKIRGVGGCAWFTPSELPQNKYYLFGKEGVKNLAEEMNVPLLGQIPIVQSICENGDNGTPEALNGESLVGQAFMSLAKNVVEQTNYRNESMEPTRIVETKK